MAKKDKNQNENGFFAKIKNFFKSLNGEIKKVIWPDKPTVAKTTAFLICNKTAPEACFATLSTS